MKRRKASARSVKAAPDLHQSLGELIADERGRLMKAETILQCASIAFDYCDGDGVKRPYFSNIAAAVADMLYTTIDNLDAARLRAK